MKVPVPQHCIRLCTLGVNIARNCCLKIGADPNQRGGKFGSAMGAAIEEGYDVMVELLGIYWQTREEIQDPILIWGRRSIGTRLVLHFDTTPILHENRYISGRLAEKAGPNNQTCAADVVSINLRSLMQNHISSTLLYGVRPPSDKNLLTKARSRACPSPMFSPIQRRQSRK